MSSTPNHPSPSHPRLLWIVSFCFVSSLIIWGLIALYYAGSFLFMNFPVRIEDASFEREGRGNRLVEYLIDEVGFSVIERESIETINVRKVTPWMATDGGSYFFMKVTIKPDAFQFQCDSLADQGRVPAFNHKASHWLNEGAAPRWWDVAQDEKPSVLLNDERYTDRKRDFNVWIHEEERAVYVFFDATH